MKKIHLFVLLISTLILVEGCGYKKIYSSDNLKFKVNKINYDENNLNNQIVKIIKSFSNSEGLNSYDLNLKTTKEKRVVSKNSKGDAETYEIKIVVELNIFNEVKNYTKSFTSQAKYKDDENKFKLKQYEVEVEKQIIEKIIEKILLFFTDI